MSEEQDDQSYEWDRNKAGSNWRKHGVSFEEAKSVFDDPFMLTVFDDSHSDEEERFVSIGKSSFERLLTIIHTPREDVIRIISCRKASRSERDLYESGY